jgi:hypothetical protein
MELPSSLPRPPPQSLPTKPAQCLTMKRQGETSNGRYLATAHSSQLTLGHGSQYCPGNANWDAAHRRSTCTPPSLGWLFAPQAWEALCIGAGWSWPRLAGHTSRSLHAG